MRALKLAREALSTFFTGENLSSMAQLHVTRVKREFREIVTSDEVTYGSVRGEKGPGCLVVCT